MFLTFVVTTQDFNFDPPILPLFDYSFECGYYDSVHTGNLSQCNHGSFNYYCDRYLIVECEGTINIQIFMRL